jgi:serine protease Do
MKKIRFIFLALFFTFSFQTISNSNSVPASFADLAERLMPSVVNISTTQTVVTNTNPLPFTFPPDHLLKICSGNLELPKKENHLL